ncbi:trans-aconitate 2-methyltransferase [Paenibacillus sp. R14(2021)]|uniref:class I SAM-dependent methyltransferase n=1 Tax=Paenibacillus sp. R14(2021) TaxID=2859228 RepID=UPI001C6143D7|nr:class I SAM-dependent methyltransferase [Paenibacillus sp. R14(2021)]
MSAIDSARLFNDMLNLTTELFYQQEEKLILRERLQSASSVLDIGSGNGSYLAEIKQHYPHLRCTGLEKDERIFAYAETRSMPGLDFIRDDYKNFKGKEPFDLVISRLVVPHLPDLPHFLDWLRSVTHKDSTIIIIDLLDAATGPVPAEGLPLFEALFRASRKPITDKFPGSVAEHILDAAIQAGYSEAAMQTYRINAAESDSRKLLHRYMGTVTELMQRDGLKNERNRELDGWLTNEDASYQVGMFALTMKIDQRG